MDLSTLLNFFGELVRQLPSKSVLFCVFDELLLYETTNLERDTDRIVRQLTELTDKVVFKSLVTCQGQSLNFQKHFKNTEILNLPEDIEVDDMATWNVMNI